MILRRAAVLRAWDKRGGAVTCEATTLLPCSDIPDTQRTPCLSTWGSRFKNKPATTYSPTPTKVQYHRREESYPLLAKQMRYQLRHAPVVPYQSIPAVRTSPNPHGHFFVRPITASLSLPKGKPTRYAPVMTSPGTFASRLDTAFSGPDSSCR